MSVWVCSGYHNKIRQAWWCKRQTFISHSPGGWESKTKVPADLVLGEGPAPGLQTAASSAHVASSLCPWRERALVSLPLLTRTLIPSWGLYLVTSSKPSYSQRPHPPIPSLWGLGLQHKNLGVGGTNIQFAAVSLPLLPLPHYLSQRQLIHQPLFPPLTPVLCVYFYKKTSFITCSATLPDLCHHFHMLE